MEKTSLNVKFFDWDYLHLTTLMKETYFKDLDSEDLYSEDDISTVSEEAIVVTSTNGQMIFEIEDPLEEQKAKKTKISDEKMF